MRQLKNSEGRLILFCFFVFCFKITSSVNLFLFCLYTTSSILFNSFIFCGTFVCIFVRFSHYSPLLTCKAHQIIVIFHGSKNFV